MRAYNGGNMAKTERYINNGQQRLIVKDRTKGYGYTHTRKYADVRWIVWNETTQTVVSEHPTLSDACQALEQFGKE